MPEKVNAVTDAPVPENVTQLRAYLGLVNYYRRFLPDLATLLHPLNQLLEKNRPWKWTSHCQETFQKSKKLITSDVVLVHYDVNKPLILATDASAYGLGCVLSHQTPGGDRPIAFASRSLNAAEKNYSQIDKEALAIVWGVKKFHQYLYGRKFTLLTDHQPLTSILHPEKSIPTTTAARLQRYALVLAAHDYVIKYKKSSDHGNADGLSRLPLAEKQMQMNWMDSADIFYISQMEMLPVTHTDIKRETYKEPTLAQVVNNMKNGWPETISEDLKPYWIRRHEMSLSQECLMWGIRVVIPTKLRASLLRDLHLGHLGVVKMKSIARNLCWWPGLDKDIEKLTRKCEGCVQTMKMPQKAKLHPWEWPTEPWTRIHVDYAGPFQNKMFLVIVDAHSKWPEVIIVQSTTTHATIGALREVFARNGVPSVLVSDNGPQFTSEEFANFMRVNGIRHKKSAPYHPATNGQAERFVQTFKHALTAMEQEPGSTSTKLHQFLLQYRNAQHPTTNQTPAMLFMKRQLRTRLDLIKPDNRLQCKRDKQNNVQSPQCLPHN